MQTTVGILQIAATLVVFQGLCRIAFAAALALAEERVVAILEAGARVTVVIAIGAVHFGRLLKVLLDALQIVAEQMANWMMLVLIVGMGE